MTLILGAATLCSGASITYNVAQTIGAGGVTGFIQTDGTIGVLNASNIAGWNLLLTDGANSIDLTPSVTGGNSAVFNVIGSGDNALSATSSELLFNFGGSTPYGLGFDTSISLGYNDYLLLDQGAYATNDFAVPGAGQGVDASNSPTGFPFSVLSGTQVIGTAASSAPEPSTFALLAVGAALAAFWTLRKKRSEARGPL